MKENISMTDILKICFKRWYVTTAITVVCAIIAFLYSSFIATPMYKSEGQIHITNTSEAAEETKEITSSGLNAGVKLGATFMELLKNDTFLGQVKNTGNFDLSEATIRDMVELKQPEDTTLIDVRVNSANSKEAYMIADQILYLAPRYLEGEVRGTNVKVVQEAKLETTPYSPKTTINILLGMAIGIVIGIIVSLCLEFLTKKITGTEVLEEAYEYPVLGEIPNLRGGRGSGVY